MIVITFHSISFLVLMASTSTSGHSKPEPTNDLFYNDSFYKFHVPHGDPKTEIIFFHDIEWEICQEPHVQTWMSSSEPPVCWPKAWLSVKYPEARILSARYDAGNWKGKTTGHMKLHSLANNLRQNILSIYKNSCPIFMVGHGLGGLVIKALIQAVQRNRDDLARVDLARNRSTHKKAVTNSDRFLRNVRGLFYYDTSFLGTKLADMRRDLPNSGSMWDRFFGEWLGSKLAHITGVSRKSGAMWVNLELLNSDICDLNEWFREWRSATNCEAISISASLPTNIPWDRHVVAEASARFDVNDFYTSLKNHFNVCKPFNETDSSFIKLIELIGPNVQAIAQGDDGNLRDGLSTAGFAKTHENAEDSEKAMVPSRQEAVMQKFIKEAVEQGGVGFFVNKTWLFSLDEYEKEEWSSALRRAGYLEIFQNHTTIFYERL